MTEMAILYDTSLCTNCKGCQVACKVWNNLLSPIGTNENKFSGSLQNPADLNGNTRLIQTFQERDAVRGQKPVDWIFNRRSCQHCTEAPCATVCPAGAITKDEDTGFVHVDDSKCVGCHYCEGVCPFDVPRYRTEGIRDYVNKCTGCPDRVAQGMDPACVSTCQPNALRFGPRDEMLELAQERLEILKGRGYEDAEIYGANEMGGLHVISVLKYGREATGLPANPSAPATVGMTRVMKPITGVVTGLTVVGLAAMFALGVGYKRDKLVYNPETEDTVSLITGDVVKHGDAQDEKSIKEHILENHPFGIGKGGSDE